MAVGQPLSFNQLNPKDTKLLKFIKFAVIIDLSGRLIDWGITVSFPIGCCIYTDN